MGTSALSSIDLTLVVDHKNGILWFGTYLYFSDFTFFEVVFGFYDLQFF